MKRLAIISTHPIQYNAPVFKMLAATPGLEVKVFYTLGKPSGGMIDKGFGKVIDWDIPLLEGYAYQFLQNTSVDPSTSHFKGIINPTIIQDVEAFEPTDLLVFGWSFSSHFKLLKYFKNKISIYFRGDSTLLDETKGLKLLLRRLALTWTYHYIDKAFYVGTNNKKYFFKHGVKEQNLIFAPHAIDNERFGNDALHAKESLRIRKDLGIPQDHIVFLFSGKFESKKNPLLLLKAFIKLNKAHNSLLFVGNGVLEDELKKAAAGHDNIYFLPFKNQSQMPAVYRAGDVLVLPSSGPGETWGLCINEAMASGRPVVASSKVGCAVDLVQDYKNGFIFEAGSKDGLLEKLQIYASMSKDELSEMGKASRDIISNWSFSHLCEAVKATILDSISYRKM